VFFCVDRLRAALVPAVWLCDRAFHPECFCRIRSYLSLARKQGRPLMAAIERAFRGPAGGSYLLRPEQLPILFMIPVLSCK